VRVCFDLDDTLCHGSNQVDGVTDYSNCYPNIMASSTLRTLRAKGHTVIIQTARGMTTGSGRVGVVVKNIGLLTLQQLEDWGFEYDEIYFGKPSADLYIDDKGQNALDFWKELLEAEETLWQ